LASTINGNQHVFFREILLGFLAIVAGNNYFCRGFCYVEITIMKNSVNYCGVIERVEGDRICVKITQQSACAGCHAKSACMAANGKEHIIEVTDYTGTFHTNEAVTLEGKDYMELKAILLAFVIPLVLVVAFIVIGTSIQWNESVSALAGLSLVLPYYIILYFFRNALKQRFVFTIKKINP
jgi:sigma-E factor negative regulatory protein RseC